MAAYVLGELRSQQILTLRSRKLRAWRIPGEPLVVCKHWKPEEPDVSAGWSCGGGGGGGGGRRQRRGGSSGGSNDRVDALTSKKQQRQANSRAFSVF
ncbi:hypothetical protein STEG23_013907 [Scotinomys teguina]